jgi:hypothetical protein
MDRRERYDDPVEATRAALDGKQAEIWTALPGIVQSFDPDAMTVTVQPAVKGQFQDERGNAQSVDLPVLADVPVCFPCGGGFTLTYPVKKGDEVLVVFGSRCIDGWWQNGDVGERPDERMHDLSDGFAIIGPRSQLRKLDPSVDSENVQLRTDDGKAHITMMPDYTIRAQNPTSSVTMTPGGDVEAKADSKITLDAPLIVFRAAAFTMEGRDGGIPTATIRANIDQTGWHKSTEDQVAGGISQINHTHIGCQGGSTGKPQ